MQRIIDGLYVSEREQLPFGPSLEVRAYLLQRDQGNLLVYRSAALDQDAEDLAELGGVSQQYLNHAHEAAPVCDWVRERFKAPLNCHQADAAAAASACVVDATFDSRHFAGDDFEVIPIPGHTPGATAYLWETGSHRVLFTGDSIIPGVDHWSAVALKGLSDRDRYITSLEMISALEFDLIVPWATSAGTATHAWTTPAERRQQVAATIARLRAGHDH